MIAYGWSYHELADSHTHLVDYLRWYTVLHQLACDMEDFEIAQPLRYSGMEEGSGVSEHRMPNKRPHGSSDDADHQFKRVKPARIFEEPEISKMTGLAPVPWEPGVAMMAKLVPAPWN